MSVLAIRTPTGGVLGAVGPLGLLAAAGSALLIDLDEEGPSYPGEASLAHLVERGPTAAELSPARRGAALLSNGGILLQDALDVVLALMAGWPRVILRLPAVGAALPESLDVPVVSVHPLLAVEIFAPPTRPAVYQRMTRKSPATVGNVVLPVPSSTCWSSLLAGRLPAADRWVWAWRRVWAIQWA